jgi:hypothetical protein
MPNFHYDLVVGRDCRDQGCIELVDCAAAISRADGLARDFLVLRPDLAGHGAAIRVVDENKFEIYRTPVDPIPEWPVSHRGQ